ncbi:MAG: response regulator [Alphaproteobacteria bacterium]|nr:response regulator [Alphaproteobacteria bacterium]
MAEKIDFSTVSFLIVDKNPLSANFVKDILAMLGTNIILVAKTTDRALQILRSEEIDVVITEYLVEPEDGVEFIDQICNGIDSPDRQIPIIMLTANSEPVNVSRARDAGVSEFLTKPFNVEGLYRRLVSVIARPRSYINSEGYFGPDRRRRQMPHDGPDRRAGS